VAVFPTNDNLVMIFVEGPRSDFNAFHADTPGHFAATLDMCGDLGQRVRDATRAERFRATPDLPNTFRRPFGPGWALVGDAGVVMDPVSAQGITNAFCDADLLAAAVVDGLDGRRPMPVAMADYWRRRDTAISPMYDFTIGLAALRPPGPRDRYILESLVGRPDEIDRFLGLFAGTISIKDYQRPTNLLRLLGIRGLTRAVVSGMTHR
jgi:2-polyprenyl-6-methoxyphenol hydroxylase-like FAD-dependent oxidoreductase